MKKTFLLSLLASAAIALPASAAVVRTTGTGSATPTAKYVQYAADFEGNTTLSNTWSEGGLTFTQTNALGADNGGCGYAGEVCADPANGLFFSESFDGNFFKTAGNNAYLSISTGDILNGIEFAVDSGYNTIYVLWQTWLDGVLTSSGKLSLGAGGIGGVLGLSDASGFDEVRVYTFDSASDNSGFSSPAIDSVRAFKVPEPGSLALALLAGIAVAAVGRRRRR
jgi:hypothetical protein